MIALSYARLSVDDPDRDGPSNSITDQHAANREWIAAHGMTCAAELTDDGWSGTLWDRPGLQRALGLLREGAARVIVLKNQSRLARGQVILGKILWEIEASGGRCVFRLEENQSRLEQGIRTVIDEEHVERTREVVTTAMRKKAERAEYTGGTRLFGYRWASRTERVVVPEEASIVRRIFAGFDPLGRACAKADLCTETGFDRQRIHRILTHPGYAGAYTYGRHSTVKGKRHQLRRTDPSRWVVTWGAHPAIVPRETWERCQERLRGLSRTYAAANPAVRATLPLTGLLRCGDCGAAYRVVAMHRVRRTGLPRYYYGCATRHPRHPERQPAGECSSGERVTVDGWVEQLLGRLAEVFVRRELARDIHAALQRAYEAGRKAGHLEAEVARLERSERSITAAITSGELLDTKLLAAELARSQRSLQAAKEALRRDQAETGSVMPVDSIQGLLRGAASDLEEISGDPRVAEIARPLLHRFVESVMVWPREQRAEILLQPAAFGRLSADSRGWAIDSPLQRVGLPRVGWVLPARAA